MYSADVMKRKGGIADEIGKACADKNQPQTDSDTSSHSADAPVLGATLPGEMIHLEGGPSAARCVGSCLGPTR